MQQLLVFPREINGGHEKIKCDRFAQIMVDHQFKVSSHKWWAMLDGFNLFI